MSDAEVEDGPSSARLDGVDSRLRVLADVSHVFASTATDYDALLRTIVRASADRVGDGCLVTLIDTDGEHLLNAASAHRDPAFEADFRTGLEQLPPLTRSGASITATVIRTGEARLVREIEPEEVAAQSDEVLRPLVLRINIHSFCVVPIRAKGTTLGVLSLFRSRPGRGYTEDDLTLLSDMADRAGLAIENARLYAELEQRVRDRTTELEVANGELEAFSAAVAHDLRAPLRSMAGFSEILLDEQAARLDDEGRRYLRHVQAAARQMNQLIDALLDLSHASRRDVRREVVDLSVVAASVVEKLRAAEPDGLVEVSIAPGLLANADPQLVGILLVNLLANAWKFTRGREAARVDVFASSSARPTVFAVRDNGSGFDPVYAGKLFAAFQRLHSSHDFEGTGIGLATVARIVRRHGGHIWAESAVDRGATFLFTLEPEHA